jgi:hypothetical protein
MTSTEAPDAAGGVRFPSVEWFERLAAIMKRERARHEHLGYVDCVAQFTVLDGRPDGGPWSVQVTFEEFDVTDVRESAEGEESRADFVCETDLDTWREMIESIRAGNGRPNLDHTLNYLSLPGTPIRVWSDDPIRRDLFFRVNQSLQEFFNASAEIPTVFA